MRIKELETGLMALALFICTVIIIITEHYINVQPNWLKDIICVLLSFIFSWTFVFCLLKNLISFFWSKANKKYFIAGKWYVIYHDDLDTPKYIRSGTARVKQYIDQIKMDSLLMRTPIIKGVDNIVGFDTRTTLDNDPNHKISTGSGEYYIDFQNLILKGFYNLFRAENNTNIMGLDICTIHIPDSSHASPQHLSGNFYNAEKGRKKPMSGIVVKFKSKEMAEDYIRKLLIKEPKNQ